MVDEFTRECLTIDVARKQSSRDVLRALARLMLRHGIPKHIRSDNGPEFVAKAVRKWLSRLGVETLFIEPGSPWENGYIESFNGSCSRASRRSAQRSARTEWKRVRLVRQRGG